MDIRLHFVERGVGFPLILLHGNGESSDYFAKQIEAFSTSFRVIAVDTRGHGNTPRGQAPFTLSQFADDLKAFLDAQGIERAHILGFSDGANIAILFAQRYPGYVGKLILNGADLHPSGVRRSVQLPIIFAYRLVSFVARFDERAVPKKEMLGLMVTQPDIQAESLAMLTMPVLVIAGTKDMILESHTRLIADSLPDSRLILLEGDHFIASKNSPAFNKAVASFLSV